MWACFIRFNCWIVRFVASTFRQFLETDIPTAMGYAVAFLECPLGYTHPTSGKVFLENHLSGLSSGCHLGNIFK